MIIESESLSGALSLEDIARRAAGSVTSTVSKHPGHGHQPPTEISHCGCAKAVECTAKESTVRRLLGIRWRP